ncbi:Ubiquitin specific protease domain [Phytophthora cactorum]|nr:Ubiquitin specific protease domain [Phytophthora cactorum]
MHYEFVAGLEVTYGNALAAGGGFHRVTTAEGAAAEVSPHTYLWYKLSSEAPTQKASPPSSSDSDYVPLAITQLCIGDEQPPSGHEDAWTKLDKSVDRHNGRFLWYQASQFQPPTSPSAQHKQLMPLKEIRVVRDLKDVPEGFESLDEPLLSADDTGSKLSSEDFAGSKWSILNQKAGNWIDVKDLSSNKWSVAQILQHSTSEIRVHIPTWKKGRDEFLSRSTCRNRVAKLGTHTNVYMSQPTQKQKTYLPRYLIPFIERSLLCTFLSSDLADEMNAFHQHVLKNVIACMLGDDAGSVVVYMLSLLRMILNGHSSCMFFYIKYPGSYTAAKYQRLVYTSYLVSPDALAAIPTRHPCRSFYFIDNVDLFVQAGGFRLILQRLAGPDIALTEVLLYCTILNEAKPCLTQQKRRRSSSSSRRRSTTEAQTEDFFREFLNATFSRLRRMSGEELKDDDGLIDHIVGVLDLLCRDGLLLGSRSAESDIDESAAADGSGSSCDVEFAEAIEIFHLDLSKKFICCPYLSQRLLGISRINDLISMAQRKDTLQRKASLSLRRTSSSVSTTSTLSASNSSDNLTSTSGEQPVTKWLRTKYIVEWLTASDILEVILGDRESCTKYSLQEGTHLEIMKRSKKIFGFVAAHGLLTEKHIVLMWKTALSQLRSGRKTVFDILITLCGVLSADLMDVVVMLLTQVPLSDYDELVVNFIKRVIMIASKLVVDAETGGFKISLTSLVSAASGSRNKLSASAQKDLEVFNKVVSLCCTLYWNAILQTEAPNESGSLGLRPSMRGEVEAALADSLNHVQKLWISSGSSSSTSGKEQQQLLSDYLRKCAENIKSGTLVETSMSLIQRIVDGYGGGSSSLAASLTRANSPPTTSSELLKELNNAHNIVSVVVEAIQNYVAQSDPKNRSQTAHLVVIKNRLAFLGYIVTKSDLKLPFEAVCQFGAYSGHTGFSEAVVGEIFQSLIRPASPDGSASQISLDMHTMSKESFWALERLFRFVNTSTRRISSTAVVGSTPSRSVSPNKEDTELFVVEAMDLQGLESLYDVALRAESDIVSQQAINYLIYLQLHVGSKLVRREVWADFVERCLWRLKEEVKTTIGASKTREVLRLLVLLSTFLHQSSYRRKTVLAGGAFDGPEELTVYVRTQGGRVAAPFNILDFHGAAGVAAAAAAGVGGTGNNSSPESDWHAIKTEISGNDTWVALLFKLLLYNDGIAEEAWKVLKLLTVDEEMEKQTRTLNSVLAIDGSIRKKLSSFEWEMLLDSKCPPKLLYQLELVEKFALCSDGRNDDDDDDNEDEHGAHTDAVIVAGLDSLIGTVNTWSASFIELGGRARLEEFVLSSIPRQLLAQGTLSVMCLSKLLKLLRHFVLVESKLADENGDTLEGNPQQLIHQLLETLSSLQSIDKAAKEADASTLITQASQQQSTSSKSSVSPLSLTVYTRPQVEDPDNIDDIPSDAYLMTRLLSCIATCTLEAKQGALVLLESYSGHGEIILHCLVESRFKPVRLEAANVIAALSTTRNKLQEDRVACCNYFLQLLGDYSRPVSDEEYYNVFTLLVTSADDLAKFAILPSSQILCRRIKAFEIKDDALGVPADSTPPISRRRSIEGSRRKGPTGPAPGNQVLPPAPDALLEGQLSTLLAIIKRIPAVLADGVLDVPCDGRSLREVVAPSLHDQEGIINELFHECLFATPDKQMNGEIHSEGSEGGIVDIQASSSSQYYLRQPKCRSDSCRKVAFDLLTELSIDNTDGLRFLLTQIANQHTLERPPEPSVATSAVSTSKRKNLKTAKDQLLQRGKYVGLKNLGCTCYLNSTVQSFFMMPRFRRQVLRLQSSGNGGDKAEAKSLTYELQSLFAHLEGSAKPYYNPRPFTRAMKTWDGETVDVNVQQDASEFLTSFFQQIESEMNGISAGSGDQYTSDENILNTFFGGEFSNELVAEGDRYSERFEPFHFISVPVRDRKNLKESLDGWVEGEKVSYTWENGSGAKTEVESGEEEEKVTLETHKRISISKLPAYLIIHLKRFEFDFEKMQQIKLHDRFEFPTELDMYPYTKEGQQDKRKRSTSSADEGTTSHDVRLSTSSDSADDGRTTAPEYSHHKNQWYEFNDTLVTPFDPTQIPDECFGGEDSARARHDSASGSPSLEEGSPLPAKMKNRSSFMLFYARASPELGIVSDEDASCFSFSTAVLVAAFCSRLKRRASARLAHLRGVAQVIAPEPIRKLIAMENRLFWRKRYLYDTRCLKFTYNLLRSCLVGLENAKNMAVMPRFEPVEVQFEALQVATKFVFGTLWQGGDVSKVLEWRLILQSLYHSDVGGCRWFLSTMKANESLLLELLVFNEHREVRELMANVISEAIVTTSNTEFEEEAEEKSPSSSSDGKKQLPASFEFMFFLIQLMPALLSVPVHHHRQYFLTMYDFVQTGRNEGSFLVVNSVVGAIVSLLTGLGNTQPLLQLQLKKHKSRQILKRIDLSVTILKLLSVLIRCSLPPAMDVESDAAHPLILPANMAQEHVDLTPADHDVLLNERFITLLTQRASRYTKETKPLEQIVSHLCWESRRVTAAFLDKIMHGIEVEDHHDVKPYFRTLNSLLKIRDSLAVERLTDGLTKLVAVMASQQRYFKATETSLDMLARLAKRHSGVTQWLRDNHQSCVWMEKWLMAHRGAEGYLQQRKTVLVKPNSTSSWVNVSATSSGLIKAIDRSISKLLPRIRSILDPEAVVETFYDSDDNPQRLVGKRVRVKWAKDKWYEGTVQQFNEDTYEHFVAYDDGDKRSRMTINPPKCAVNMEQRLAALRRDQEIDGLRVYLIKYNLFPRNRDPHNSPIRLEELKELVKHWKLHRQRGFWRDHPDKDDLVRALLQHIKSEATNKKRRQEAQDNGDEDENEDDDREQAVAVAKKKNFGGDLFYQRGDYDEGLIYLSRIDRSRFQSESHNPCQDLLTTSASAPTPLNSLLLGTPGANNKHKSAGTSDKEGERAMNQMPSMLMTPVLTGAVSTAYLTKEMKLKSVEGLYSISCHKGYEVQLLREGALATLSSVLKQDDPTIRLYSAAAILNLAHYVPAPLSPLPTPVKKAQTRSSSSSLLAMAPPQATKDLYSKMMDEGVIAALLDLVHTPHPTVKALCARALLRFTVDESHHFAMVHEGVVAALSQIMATVATTAASPLAHQMM